MKLFPHFSFVLSVVLSLFILLLIPVNHEKVAALRLERLLRNENFTDNEVWKHCSELQSATKGPVERAILNRYAQGTFSTEPRPCSLTTNVAHSNRFFAQSVWAIKYFISDGTSGWDFTRAYSLSFPTLLALFPLAIFFLGLLFEFKWWGVISTFVGTWFLLSGGNLVRATYDSYRYFKFTVLSDAMLWGLSLFVLWLSWIEITQNALPEVQENRKEGKWESRGSTGFGFLLALWSPTIFSLAARGLTAARGKIAQVSSFFGWQLVLACLSLYLLGVDSDNLSRFFQSSLTMPRYFSFSVLLFLGTGLLSKKNGQPLKPLTVPHFWPTLIAVLALEILARKISVLAQIPALVRVGSVLLISQALFHAQSFVPALKRSRLSLTVLLVTAVFSNAVLESGMADLLTTLMEPRIHPSAIVLFGFLCGMLLSLVSGSFSTAWISLFPLLMQSYDLPLIKAATLDGMMAGVLFSPFSIHNLLVARQLRLNFREVMIFRFRQLGLPIVMAVAIYGIGSINTVAILRPVTFLFLCLVALVIKMRSSHWKLSF